MANAKIDLILEIVTETREKVGYLDKRLGSVEVKVDSLDKRVSTLESDMAIVKSQLHENTEMLKAIHHRQEKSDAKIESLTLDMAKLHGEWTKTNEKVAQHSEEQKSIKEVLGEHEIAIRSLKRQII